MMNNNTGRSASFNNAQRPAANNPTFNRGPQQTYRPQAQQQYHAAPQQSHQAPQQSRPQESHGGGHDGGHGGHGR